jgi:hypothetical protein
MSNEARTCPVCESPLTTDAIREGRCQCCGSQLPKGEASKTDEKKLDS